MPHAFQIHKQDAAYFLTLTTVEWIDAFRREENKIILCDSLNFCVENKGLKIYSYVIMSSHLHMIAKAQNGNLSDVIRDYKKYTAFKIINGFKTEEEINNIKTIEIINSGGQVQKKKSKCQLWQYNNHAEEVYGAKFTYSKINYIHANPVKAGLVQNAIDYRFSSARDYSGGRSPVKVTLLNLHSLI
jgi:REP element-mobilizing transposase RayT